MWYFGVDWVILAVTTIFYHTLMLTYILLHIPVVAIKVVSSVRTSFLVLGHRQQTSCNAAFMIRNQTSAWFFYFWVWAAVFHMRKFQDEFPGCIFSTLLIELLISNSGCDWSSLNHFCINVKFDAHVFISYITLFFGTLSLIHFFSIAYLVLHSVTMPQPSRRKADAKDKTYDCGIYCSLQLLTGGHFFRPKQRRKKDATPDEWVASCNILLSDC